MNEANYLAEVLRETASELLRLTKNINDSYRKYAEYVLQQEQEQEKTEEEKEAALEERYKLGTFQPKLFCLNCFTPITAENGVDLGTHCLTCGEEYE